MLVVRSKGGVMDGYRHGLTDPQWRILKPLMEQVGGTNGRKPVDNRRWIDTLFWMSKDVVSNNFPISEQNAVLPDVFLKKQAEFVKSRDEHTDELHARH